MTQKLLALAKSLLSPRKYSRRLVAFVKAWAWAREKVNILLFWTKMVRPKIKPAVVVPVGARQIRICRLQGFVADFTARVRCLSSVVGWIDHFSTKTSIFCKKEIFRQSASCLKKYFYTPVPLGTVEFNCWHPGHLHPPSGLDSSLWDFTHFLMQWIWKTCTLKST